MRYNIWNPRIPLLTVPCLCLLKVLLCWHAGIISSTSQRSPHTTELGHPSPSICFWQTFSSLKGFFLLLFETEVDESYFCWGLYFLEFHDPLWRSENGQLQGLFLRAYLGNTNFWGKQYFHEAGLNSSHHAKSTHAMAEPYAKEFRNTNPIKFWLRKAISV